MNLSEIFNENAIAVDIPADSKMKALEYLTDLLYKDQAIGDESEFLKDVLIREGEGQTGIGDGIGHTPWKIGNRQKGLYCIWETEAAGNMGISGREACFSHFPVCCQQDYRCGQSPADDGNGCQVPGG